MKIFEVSIERTITCVYEIAQNADDEMEAQELAKERLDIDEENMVAKTYRIISEDIKVREIDGGK